MNVYSTVDRDILKQIRDLSLFQVMIMIEAQIASALEAVSSAGVEASKYFELVGTDKIAVEGSVECIEYEGLYSMYLVRQQTYMNLMDRLAKLFLKNVFVEKEYKTDYLDVFIDLAAEDLKREGSDKILGEGTAWCFIVELVVRWSW